MWNCADKGENREARRVQMRVEGWPRLYSKYFLKAINKNKQNNAEWYLHVLTQFSHDRRWGSGIPGF